MNQSNTARLFAAWAFCAAVSAPAVGFAGQRLTIAAGDSTRASVEQAGAWFARETGCAPALTVPEALYEPIGYFSTPLKHSVRSTRLHGLPAQPAGPVRVPGCGVLGT